MFRLRKQKSLKLIPPPPPNQSGPPNPMCGFQWIPTRFAPPPMSPGDNGYCLRDAMCTLMDWPVGSDLDPRVRVQVGVGFPPEPG